MKNINASTKSIYSVFNQNHLEEHKQLLGLSSNEWAGFKQWKALGRKVKGKGTGCKIFIFCDKKQEGPNGEEIKKKVMKSRYVFNIEHTEEI